jgi:hypothetical protein
MTKIFILRFKFNGYVFDVIFKRKISLMFKGFIEQFETIEDLRKSVAFIVKW